MASSFNVGSNATQPATASAFSCSSQNNSEAAVVRSSAVPLSVAALSSSDQTGLTKSQIKRRRRKAAAQLAAAAVVSAAPRSNPSLDAIAMQAPRSIALHDPSTSKTSSSVVAALPSLHDSSSDSSYSDDDDDDEMHQLFVAAQGLIRGALSFAESEVHRRNPKGAAKVTSAMHKIASGSHDQLASKRAEIEEAKTFLAQQGSFSYFALRHIDYARAASQLPARAAGISAIGALAHLCYILIHVSASQLPLPAAQQEVFRAWLLRVDALFTQLCAEVSRMKLTRRQRQSLLDAALNSGALQLVPVLMGRDFVSRLNITGFRFDDDEPFLTSYCLGPKHHSVCLQPYFRLFEYGLDPTLINKSGAPLSALQIARNFVRMCSRSAAVSSFDSMAMMKDAISEDLARDAVNRNAASSVLGAHGMHHREALGSAETDRREALRARFMHALIPAWLAHSTKVRALLLEAAPTRLIPPLVDVVSRYLDHEGVRP